MIRTGTPAQAASASVVGPALVISRSVAANQPAMSSTKPSTVTGIGHGSERNRRCSASLLPAMMAIWAGVPWLASWR